MNQKKITLLIILVALPILLGTVLYYLFCPDVVFVIWIDQVLNPSRKNIHIPSIYLIKFLRFYAFDFIWAFSFLSAILIVFINDWNARQLFLIVFFSEAILESLQLIDFIPGTFDILDIFTELFADVLVIFIFQRRITK